MTHIRSAKSALEAWNALQDAYEDKGMAQDLADIGKVIEDSSIAAILLGGLTSRYEPLIMALENSNVEVSTELVKRKLLNEMSKIDSTESDAAFQLKNRSTDVHKLKKNKPIVCYECNKPGHKRPDCPLRNKEKKGGTLSDKETTSFSALGVSTCLGKNKWFIDSGASKHMTPRRDWFKDIKPLEGSTVTVANGEKIVCGGIGDISINTACNVVDSIKDVAYVPELTSNLISVKKVVDKEDPNGYYFRDSSNPRSVQKSRDVTFFEDNFSQLKGNAVESVKQEPIILFDEQKQDETVVHQENNSICSDDENDYNSAESEETTSSEREEPAVDQQN
ncbi:Retrovirus-related Pol polyprotein from transposon TNT 1-94 [Operophtera brumata]|uniref:Retrovirus-related Pol polyprotein from transposon TNT 1-94 n=1 Tax=Operophtera brumata TaxID=104452 RepID=A0A0L7KS65_OPEBR|nr:Retrovirus-related Pol polyprotein from transposon TNT 1-94 [Operophtera brumata]